MKVKIVFQLLPLGKNPHYIHRIFSIVGVLGMGKKGNKKKNYCSRQQQKK